MASMDLTLYQVPIFWILGTHSLKELVIIHANKLTEKQPRRTKVMLHKMCIIKTWMRK